MAGNAPKFKVRSGVYEAAAWENNVTGKDGRSFLTYSAKLTKSYKDQQGQWKHTDQLDGRDLLICAELLRELWLTFGIKDAQGGETAPVRPAPSQEESF